MYYLAHLSDRGEEHAMEFRGLYDTYIGMEFRVRCIDLEDDDLGNFMYVSLDNPQIRFFDDEIIIIAELDHQYDDESL